MCAGAKFPGSSRSGVFRAPDAPAAAATHVSSLDSPPTPPSKQGKPSPQTPAESLTYINFFLDAASNTLYCPVIRPSQLKRLLVTTVVLDYGPPGPRSAFGIEGPHKRQTRN